MKKDSLLIFGAGALQLSIIRVAKSAGYNTIVIDPDENAPGKNIADVFLVVGGKNFDLTLQIAKQYNVKGIITAATDKPLLMMARIAEELNLPFASHESILNTIDKNRFKKILLSHNLPCAKGFLVDLQITPDDIFKNLKFPLIVKPIDSSGSRGVVKIDTIEELKPAIKEALYYSNNDKVLLEEFIEGDEISVEVLVQNKKVNILQITDKIVTEPPYNVELGHIQPSKYNYLKHAIEKILQSIVDNINLDNCALHPEFKIKNDGTIIIIEVGPRLGGDFITSDLVPLSTGVNMEDQLIKIATGQTISYRLKDGASLVSFLNFPQSKVVEKQITEDEIKNSYPVLKTFNFDLKVGDSVNQITNSLNRYGSFIISGKNVESLLTFKKEIELYIFNNIFN